RPRACPGRDPRRRCRRRDRKSTRLNSSHVKISYAVFCLKKKKSDDAQGNVHPIRRLYTCSFASGTRDTAESVTSWFARCTTKPSNPSAIVEQVAHPAV